MWEAIKPVLVQLFTSKKFLVLLAGAIVWLLEQIGVTNIPRADLVLLLTMVTGYIVGQGVADAGKGKAQEDRKTLREAREALPPPTSDPT